MSKLLERELADLRVRLVEQFTVVEQMIQLSVRALFERRTDFADRVIESDNGVDATDVKIEEECLKILALHQPVTVDMRWVVTVIKVNGELERMADTACNIAERAKALSAYPLFQVPEDLREMVEQTIGMVRRALDSFVNSDSEMAVEVIKMDDLVDALNRIIIDQLHEIMTSDPSLIEPAIHCFSASRHLERIADLAESLAEEVIYLVEGEIVRHKHGVRRDRQSNEGSSPTA